MTVYAVTYDSKSSYITNGKRYRVERDDGRGLFNIRSNRGTMITCLWEGCAHLGTRGNWTRIEEEEKVALREGDYVSTEGMTEDQYHAVARAFMAAGAASGEYPNYSFADEEISCPRWSFGNRRGALWHGLSGCFGGRHLTPAQVIGAVNAGNQQEKDNMTPCEKLGYKVGDRFVANGAPQFSDGSIVELYRDDGSYLPLWKLISGHCEYRNADSKPGAYDPVKFFEKISESHTLTQTLRDAAEHGAKAKHHAAEHERLMQRARDMLPDGWRLVRDGQPDVDMSDPANWREGDVIEWIEESGNFFTAGKRYTILAPENPEEDDFDVIDDDNERHAWDFAPAGKSFRFHSRPTT